MTKLAIARLGKASYVVEFIDEDGSVESAIFHGPNALVRAANYGYREYEHALSDPEGLLK